jgi:hypothetical protein
LTFEKWRCLDSFIYKDRDHKEKAIRLRIFWICVLSVALAQAAAAFTNDTLIAVSRYYSSDTIVVGDTLDIRFRIENGESYPLYGLFVTDQMPTGFRGLSTKVEIDGADLHGFLLEVGYDGEIYDGNTPNRWILETPPDFRQAAHIPQGGVAEIEYSVECPETGIYVFPNFSWAGGVVTDRDTLWVFGYDDGSLTITVRQTGVDGPSPDSQRTRLVHFTNYPNPFTDHTVISYELAHGMHVSLDLYDHSGRIVDTPYQGEQPRGRHSLVLSGESLPSGVYFLRLEANQCMVTRKIIVLE